MFEQRPLDMVLLYFPGFCLIEVSTRKVLASIFSFSLIFHGHFEPQPDSPYEFCSVFDSSFFTYTLDCDVTTKKSLHGDFLSMLL